MPAPRGGARPGCKGEGLCMCLHLTRGDVWQKPTRCCQVTKIKKHGAQRSFWGPPASTRWGWGHARKRLRWGISWKPQEATFPGKTFQHENLKTRFKVEFHTRPLQKSLGGVIFMLQKPDLSTRLRYRLNSLFQSKIWLENEQNGVWEKPTRL